MSFVSPGLVDYVSSPDSNPLDRALGLAKVIAANGEPNKATPNHGH